MNHGGAGMSRRGVERLSHGRVLRVAWIPVPFFVLLFAILAYAGPQGTYEPRLLLPALNIIFLTALSLVVCWLAGASYLAAGILSVLPVALGSLAFALGNALAAVAALLGLPPDFVAGMHNTASLLAGACYLLSAILMVRTDWRPTPSWPRGATLAIGLLAVTAVLGAVAAIKALGWGHLVFMGPGGPTLLRQAVLGGAVSAFALAGVLFWVVLAGAPGRFVSWYSLALLLIAVGLGGVFFEASLGTATSWAGRSAQYLGCVYLFIAVRSGPSHSFPLVQFLHETRDRYRRLVELSPDAILVHTEDEYVFGNPASARLFGASSADDLVGRPVLDLVHPDDRELVRRRIASVRAGAATPLRELRLLRMDGTPLDVEATGAPVEFFGRPAIQLVMRDITERKRAEEKVREATLEAERRASEAAEGRRILDEQAARLAEANRLKDEFLATLSHELRTPLNAILGWSHMLVRDLLDPESTKRAIEAIHRNAGAQVALINDVLDVSRIVSGKLRLETVRVDLVTCLRNALTAVRPAALARQIEIVEDLSATTVVIGDPDRLQQVFWNLLANAVKFTGQGGRVTVTIRRMPSECSVRVEDTGIGISPAFLPRVFERFSQADGSTTREHGGLGLGLAIVRHLVELHGGGVEAESEGEGRGAAFTVRLPTCAVDEATEWLQRSEFGPRVENGHAVGLAGVRVLVVDDQADARDLLHAVLRSYGAHVETVGSAAEALDTVRAWRPDVLLCDIGMPGEDGYDLLRRLRQLPPQAGGLIPAIAVTAYGRAQDRSAALAAGFVQHVAKPVVPIELAAVVAATARASRLTAG